jgi:phosphoglycerol transferase MdoB-like AlkP superfamily enzyme
MEQVLKWGGNERAFINSAYYSDSCLGVFFNEARNMSWYDSTLFIIMADHSHNSYRNHPLESFDYHKVPLMFCGPAIAGAMKGRHIDKISQTADVTVTLLNQLRLPSEDFKWGKDLMNPYSKGYAYFELHYAFGYKNPHGAFVYSWDWDHYYQMELAGTTTPAEQEELVKEGQAYLQVLFREFLDL